MRFLAVLFLMLLLYLSGNAQSSYSIGVLPLVNITAPIHENWRLNIRTESRQSFGNGLFNEGFTADYDYLLTDFSVSAARSIRLTNSFAFGALLRFENVNQHIRFLQQYTITQLRGGKRQAHRFASDQTFREGNSNSYRIRYRFSLEWALNGLVIDNGEWYFKLNNEILNELRGGEYDLELRCVPNFGLKINKADKLELGIDARLDGFIANTLRLRLWQNVSWYHVF